MDNSIAAKIEKLSKTVMEDAEREKNKLCEHMEAERKKRVESKEDEFLRTAYEEIQATASKVHKADSEMILKERNNAKRALLIKREQIIAKIFSEAEKRIVEFTATEKYRADLKEKIGRAVKEAGDGKKTVCLCERDIGVLDSGDAFEVKAEADGEMLGGVKVVNHDRNIVVNYSYRTLLDNERADFLNASGLTIL